MDPRFIEALDISLRQLTQQGMDPYMISLHLVDLATDIIVTTYPNDWTERYGTFLGNASGAVLASAQEKEDAIDRISKLAGSDQIRDPF